MGQYHRVINLDKKQWLRPHSFDEGTKLMEFGCSSQGTMTALAILLAASNGKGGGDFRGDDPLIGSWAGDRIAIVGDYAEGDAEFEWAYRGTAQDPADLEKLAATGGDVVLWEDISYRILGVMLGDSWLRKDFITRPEGVDDRYWSYVEGRRKKAWAEARPGEPWPAQQP